MRYVKQVLADPQEKERYNHIAAMVGKESAYSMAISDYFHDLSFKKAFE